LVDQDDDVRANAAFSLGDLGDSQAFAPLIVALEDRSPDLRGSAAYALGQLRDPQAILPLIAVLDDENPLVRYCAALALGEMRDPRAVQPLITLLDDTAQALSDAKRVWDYGCPCESRNQCPPPMRVCDAAAKALKQIGTAEAQAALTIWKYRTH
jgi:HEAT repeat protein